MPQKINLNEFLGTEPMRARVVADCVELIDQQVQSKSGLSGVAIKGAYGTIKRIKKGFVPDVVNALLDDWLERIQPYHDTWASGGGATFSEFLVARSDEVAEDLLSVTDRRAQNSSHKTAKKAYEKMRGSAKTNVVEAIPALGRALERRLDSAAAAS